MMNKSFRVKYIPSGQTHPEQPGVH
jgi:hypothetical protein